MTKKQTDLPSGHEIAKKIMALVLEEFNHKDHTGECCVSECCSVCYGGSTSFCRCYSIVQLLNDALEATATRTRQEDIETINKLAPLASIGFNGETHYLISRAEAINSLNK